MNPLLVLKYRLMVFSKLMCGFELTTLCIVYTYKNHNNLFLCKK